MVEHTMELRGIPISQLVTYLLECGGRFVGQAEAARDKDALPLVIQSDLWTAQIVREETVAITSRFQVNAVFIHFATANEDALSQLLKQFRLKVIRVGG